MISKAVYSVALSAFALASPTRAVGTDATCSPGWISTFGYQIDGPVLGLTVYDDGSGPKLVVVGAFGWISSYFGYVAGWDGAQWSNFGFGTDNRIRSAVSFDGGNGSELYIAGDFSHAQGIPASCIARWDGTTWSPLGSGLTGGTPNRAYALAVFDDGGGDALYVGGTFNLAGGVSGTARIARWDGAAWTGLPMPVGTGITVYALTVFDDGAGPALHAGGGGFRRWDGATWSYLTPPGGTIRAMTVYDDGGGAALYAGGDFVTGGGTVLNRIGRWDGTSWTALGTGLDDTCWSLVSYDDGTGSGPALYAGGSFTTAGGIAANRIARWDGSSWSALGNGADAVVSALEVFDDGTGPALYAGGDFTPLESGDGRMAKWGGCTGGPNGLFCHGEAGSCPCGNGGAAGSGCDNAQATGGVALSLVAQTTAPNGATLQGSGFSTMGAPTAIVIRSNALDPSSPVVFGDGLRCVNTSGLVRLAATVASGGVSQHAFAHTAMAGSGSFYYQIWYRNTPTAYCTPAAFNLSSGLQISWP